MTLVGNRAYVVHGNGKGLLLFYIDLHTKQWKSENILGPTRSYHTAVLVDDSLYIFGGSTKTYGLDYFDFGSLYLSNTLWKLDLNLGEVSECEVRGLLRPRPVANHSAHYIDSIGAMVAFGGWTSLVIEEVSIVRCNNLLAFQFTTGTWAIPIAKGQKPSPRSGMASCAHYNTIYYYGGKDRRERFRDLFILDCHGRVFQWSQPRVHEGAYWPEPTVHATLSYIGRKLILFGGVHYNSSTVLSIFELEREAWVRSTSQDQATGNDEAYTVNERLTDSHDGAVVSAKKLWTIRWKHTTIWTMSEED